MFDHFHNLNKFNRIQDILFIYFLNCIQQEIEFLVFD